MLDETLGSIWKMIFLENREKHEKINIDKDKDIDGYVSMYSDIINDKLELVNRIGEFVMVSWLKYRMLKTWLERLMMIA